MDWQEKKDKLGLAVDLIDEVRMEAYTRAESLMLDGLKLSTRALMTFYDNMIKDKG